MTDEPEIRRSRSRWALRSILLFVAVGAFTIWPQGAGSMWGSPLGETDNHWWMFWWALERLGGGGAGLVNAPRGLDLALMDPVNAPWFLLGSPFGPVAAWRVMLVGNLVLAAAGGWVLARRFVGPEAALVGAAAMGTAPWLLGVVDFGITESWPIGWLALHAGLLIGFARGRPARWALGAGICLGFAALSGWYMATLALGIELVLVPALLLRHRRPGVVGQGLVALGMVLPSFLHFQGQMGAWEARWRPPSPGPPGPRGDWAELPIFGTDLLNLVLPHPGDVLPSKSAYLGLVVVALAVIGLVRRRRAGLLLAALALPSALLAMGYWPTVGGKALGFPGPAWLLARLVPAMEGMSHWERAVGGVVPFVAAAAALGAEGWVRGRWGRAALLVGLIALDGAWLSATPWPRSTYDPSPPQGLAELPGGGGVVLLPFDNGRAPFSTDPARLYNRWQVMIDRPISENYEGVDALLEASPLVSAADAACAVPTTLPPYYQPDPARRGLPAPDGAALVEAIQSLKGWGYQWIYLSRSRCRVPANSIQLLDARLGPGLRLAGGDVAWAL